MMMILQQQQQLKQKISISQILRTNSKQFRKITERYSDGRSGRCAIGLIMTNFGWVGECDSDMISNLQIPLPSLGNIGLHDDFFIIGLNDSYMKFDEVVNYLDIMDISSV